MSTVGQEIRAARAKLCRVVAWIKFILVLNQAITLLSLLGEVATVQLWRKSFTTTQQVQKSVNTKITISSLKSCFIIWEPPRQFKERRRPEIEGAVMRERGSWDRRRKKEGKRPPSIEVSDKRGWRDKSRLPTPKLRDRHFGEQQPDNRKQHQSANQRRYTGWGWRSRTWVGLILFESFHRLPCSAWADGNLSKWCWLSNYM